MTIQAINKKYNAKVNKAYKALRKYYALVDLEDTLELYSTAMSRLESKQERAHNIYIDTLEEMPAREQINLSKQHVALHGYT
tara:strand:- start:378 stop:623 length:246 start_codon:yes stop_codon:yes gene_type:complete